MHSFSALVFGIAIMTALSVPVAVQVTPPSSGQQTGTITLKIDGWTCASCEKDIRRALEAVPGVKRADVSYARGDAVVEVEPGRVSGDQLAQAVASAGTILFSYRATVVPNGSLMAETGKEGGIGNWLRKLFH